MSLDPQGEYDIEFDEGTYRIEDVNNKDFFYHDGSQLFRGASAIERRFHDLEDWDMNVLGQSGFDWVHEDEGWSVSLLDGDLEVSLRGKELRSDLLAYELEAYLRGDPQAYDIPEIVDASENPNYVPLHEL